MFNELNKHKVANACREIMHSIEEEREKRKEAYIAERRYPWYRNVMAWLANREPIPVPDSEIWPSDDVIRECGSFEERLERIKIICYADTQYETAKMLLALSLFVSGETVRVSMDEFKYIQDWLK